MNRYVFIRRVLLTGLIIAAGVGGYQVGSRDQPPHGEELPFHTLAQGGGLSDEIGYLNDMPALVLIASPDEINIPSHAISFPKNVVEQLRSLDYGQSFVVVALMGFRTAAPSQINIEHIWWINDHVTIESKFYEPSSQPHMLNPQLGSAYHIVVVSKYGVRNGVTISNGGSWGKEQPFFLMRNGQVVVETTHFISDLYRGLPRP